MKFANLKMLGLAGGLLLLGTTACQHNPLDQPNPNLALTSFFWRNGDDANKGVIASYSGLQQLGTYRRWLNFAFDIRDDEGTSTSPNLQLADWCRFIVSNYDLEINFNIYRDHYRAITRCNQVIDNVPGIVGMDATLQKQYIAEAKFLRALYYFNMVSLYGNVPLVLKQTTNLADIAVQANESQVWAQVIKDLQEAQPDLPTSYGGNDLGRATRGAATTLLGKAYMQNRRWADASAQFAQVIGSNLYRIDNVPYVNNFRHTSENNAESIFEVQFSDAKQGGNDGDDATSSEGGQRSQFFGVPGFGFNDGEVRPWVVNEFLKEPNTTGGRDQRLAATVFYNRFDSRQFPTALPVDGDRGVYGSGNFETRYAGNARNLGRVFWRKYQTDYYRAFENFDSPINQRIMRYADVLLMQAEALNEQGQPDAAVPLINQVRSRAAMPQLSVVAGAFTKESMRTQIMHERITELTGEGTRWFDLKRWDLLKDQASVATLAARDADFASFVVGKSNLLPIPQTEIDLAKLNQNAGY